MMNQDSGFMRQWLRVYVLTHHKTVSTMANDYLVSKGLTLQTWLTSLKEGRCADILRLLLLCLATQMHCFMHIKDGYWTTLCDPPQTHMEMIQRCNVHLSYLGRGIFVDHVLRLDTSFEIFGVSDPVNMLSTSTVLGELSMEESDVLHALLSLGTCVISESGGPVLKSSTKSMSRCEQSISPSKTTTHSNELPPTASTSTFEQSASLIKSTTLTVGTLPPTSSRKRAVHCQKIRYWTY